MNRKGSLSISTNAIVILIIAVIMLGLIIGLVTRGFGAVEKKFLGQIEESEPEPPVASTGDPITLSSTAVFAAPGELIGLKINILNTGTLAAGASTLSGETKAFLPEITCLSDDATSGKTVIDDESVQVFPMDLAARDSEQFLYMAKISKNAPGGPQLCKVNALYGPAGTEDPAAVTNQTGFPAAQFKITVES